MSSGDKAVIKKLLCVICLFGILVSFTFAEEKKESVTAFAEFPEALGFYAGRISGTGLTYHKWVDGVGYQVTAGILYLPPAAGEGSLVDIGNNIFNYVVGF